MLFSTMGQIYVFGWMVGAGLLIGALYALLTGLRQLLDAGFWLTLIADILFGLGAALILAVALVTGNYGRLRFYELLGAAIGMVLFGLGLYPPVRALTRRFVRTLRHIADKVSNFRLINIIFK